MPVQSLEQVRRREETVAKKIAEKGKSADAIELRPLKKQLRRAQRKRRKIVTADARRASTAKKKKAAPAPKTASKTPVAIPATTEEAPAAE